MARIKVDLPERFPFATEVDVRIGDINYGGHLGNDSVLSLVHEARIRFLAAHGLTEKDVFGSGIIMADAAVQYKSESFHGDRLLISVAIAEIGRAGCDLVYRISAKATGKEVARVKTGLVFFDYTARKIVETPKEFALLFNNLAPSASNS